VTSSVAVFEAAVRVKSMYMIKSCLKNKNNRKIFLKLKKNLYLKDGLEMEFTV